jgi:hypothetical protein
MARHLQCRRGRHSWQNFETSEGEVGKKCVHCGEMTAWPSGVLGNGPHVANVTLHDNGSRLSPGQPTL